MQVKVEWDTGGLLGELKGEAWHTVETVVAQESRGLLGSIVSAIAGTEVTTRKTVPSTYDLDTEDGVRGAFSQASIDLRSTATALESHYIDHNTYPTETRALTTPIAYLSKELTDVFDRDHGPIRLSVFNAEEYSGATEGADGRPLYSAYRIWSVGPDREDQQGDIIYDPTNGLVSGGDIVRLRLVY